MKVLPDGSFHSVMPTPAENVRLGQARAAGRTPARPPEGHLVRIIEYTVTVHDSGGGTRTESFRLVTTLLDHEHAPAAQVAASYQQRWEIENSYSELKTRLRGASFILRSRSPELVRQELFAFVTIYQALCALRAEAASAAGIDPDRVSFTVTIRVARDHAASQARVTTLACARARGQAIGDILDDLLPRWRRNRQCERAKKPPKNTFPSKKRDQLALPQKVTYKIKITRKALPDRPWPARTP